MRSEQKYKVCPVSFATTLRKHSTSSVIFLKLGEVRQLNSLLRECQVSTRTIHSEVHIRNVT